MCVLPFAARQKRCLGLHIPVVYIKSVMQLYLTAPATQTSLRLIQTQAVYRLSVCHTV